MWLTHAGVVVAVAALSVLGRPVLAQDKPVDLIPRDLVVALLGGGGMSDPDIRIGRPAAGLPASALPRDGIVVGSMATVASSTTVVAVPGSSVAALAAIEAGLLADGWTSPPTPAPSAAPRGFTDGLGSLYGQSPYYCHERDYLTVRATPRRTGESQILITLQSGQQYSPCSPPNRSTDPYRGLPMPALMSPPASRISGSNSSQGGDYSESRAKLISRLSAAELLAHYGALLKDAGWSTQPATAAPVVASQIWQSKDKDGNTVYGMLMITVTADAEPRQLAFRTYRQ